MAEKPNLNQSSKAISWVVFLITSSVVIISLISVVFPALIVRTFSPIDSSLVNPWEPGPLAFNVILANIIIFGIGFAYWKNKLPLRITKKIKYLHNFEVSKQIALLVLVILLSIYIYSNVNELVEKETGIDAFPVVRQAENWSIDEFNDFNLPIRFFLLSTSIEIFDNIRVIPFFASITLITLTYFFTLELSQKRFAGLIAVAILIQSFIFLKYDTRSTYENFWTVFYLLSIYIIYKAWPLSPFVYILSIFSKQLTAIFIPMTLFFIYRAKISKTKKVCLTISYIFVIAIGISIIHFTDIQFVQITSFSEFYFWQGFTSVAHSLRFDFIVIIFLLPLTVGLFIISRKGFVQADSILILIGGILFSAPLLTGFTELTNQPYRFIPLIVFFAVGMGVIFSKKDQRKIKLA